MVLAGALVLALDQATKAWINATMVGPNARPTIDVIEGFVRLRYTENTGAAFGFFQGWSGLLSIAAIGIILAILFSASRVHSNSPATMLALGLITGGAIGNLIDRLRFGYVVDFVDVYGPHIIFNDTVYTWPVFNVADSSISVGVVLLMITLIFGKQSERRVPGGEYHVARET